MSFIITSGNRILIRFKNAITCLYFGRSGGIYTIRYFDLKKKFRSPTSRRYWKRFIYYSMFFFFAYLFISRNTFS